MKQCGLSLISQLKTRSASVICFILFTPTPKDCLGLWFN